MNIINQLFIAGGIRGIFLSSVNIVLLILFIPQIILLYKNKSSKDLSISSLALSIYAQLVTLYYFGIEIKATAYIVVSLFSLVPLTITTIQAIYYRYIFKNN